MEENEDKALPAMPALPVTNDTVFPAGKYHISIRGYSSTVFTTNTGIEAIDYGCEPLISIVNKDTNQKWIISKSNGEKLSDNDFKDGFLFFASNLKIKIREKTMSAFSDDEYRAFIREFQKDRWAGNDFDFPENFSVSDFSCKQIGNGIMDFEIHHKNSDGTESYATKFDFEYAGDWTQDLTISDTDGRVAYFKEFYDNERGDKIRKNLKSIQKNDTLEEISQKLGVKIPIKKAKPEKEHSKAKTPPKTKPKPKKKAEEDDSGLQWLF